MKILNSLTLQDVRNMSDDNLQWLADKTSTKVLESFSSVPDWLDRLEDIVESELQLRNLLETA